MYSVTSFSTGSFLIITFLIFNIGNKQIVLSAFQWQEPYFLDPRTTGVQWQASDTAVGIQTINVQEELPVPYKLAQINYNGSIAPSLGAFDIGDNSLLGARINFTDNQWFIIIEKRLDYENPQQRIYFFQIYIKDMIMPSTIEPSVFIKLENIFDNQPTLTYAPSPCRVEELHANYITDCIFLVYDPDGMERNYIRIEAKENNNENFSFNFVEYGETSTYEQQFKLKILKELHYEEKAIYNLDVKVYDANNNTGSIFAILEVIDLPNRDPIWVRPLTTATFSEKQEQIFSLKAIDGDTGIDKPICYSLEFEEDYSNLISINSSTGILHVQPIDRDVLKQQIFTFYILAYKCDDPLWFIKNSTILIVQDVNDHKPEITLKPKVLRILESKHLTLPLEKFFIEDLDLGINATYEVLLENFNGNINYVQAFTLIPNNGYQRTNFSLTVTDQMDYENENWRNFQLKILAKEIENTFHTNEVSLNIELINWNDESPLFKNLVYELRIYENATKGTELIQIQAHDRDIGDKVMHSIVGSIQGITIDPLTGSIALNQNNVFDFEHQALVTLQVQAKDTLITDYYQNLHTSYAQLQITVLDVNDETPELRMPRFIVNITENSPALTLLTNKIEARDPDTSANLNFEILWSQSYATKSGQEVDKNDFHACFVIETDYVDNNNLIYGMLKINKEFQSQLDYEKYDTIFLTIKVEDLNQEINENSTTAVLTIRVDDLNDNAPQFVLGTLQEPRSVTDMEDVSSVIGTIHAYDLDGIGNNNITFKLRSLGEFTQPGWISINSTTGVLKVAAQLQCDIPKIYYLEYEITATDLLHETKGKFNISVMDINNQVPILDDFEQQVFIFENATTGTVVGHIRAHDNDRDPPHNTLEYAINSAAFSDLHNLFQINTTNGIIKVKLRNGFILDRDMGTTFHYIPIDIRDNFNFINSGYGPVNQISTFLNVTLLDVNDNAPTMPDSKRYKPQFSEADGLHTVSSFDLVAEDRDEPNTPNSQLIYSILSIRPVQNFDAQNYENLFSIVTLQNQIGRLKTLKPLKGYFGLWQLEIQASDQGIPHLKNSSVYEVYIKPYNFHVPKIVHPSNRKSLRICYSLQEPLRPLYQADCVTRMKSFEVYDPDGGEYGDVHFEMSSDAGYDKYFELVKETRNITNLYVKQILQAGVYNINLRAIDGGGSTSTEIRNLKIVFVDMLGNPMFLQNAFTTNFTENDLGLLEERFIPQAYDPKNEGLEDQNEAYKLYYFIDETFHPDDAKLFVLNSNTRLLKLNTVLDRETIEQLSIRIKVSNSEKGLISNPNSVNYTLLVNISVNDVNDNEPKFTQEMYAAGITTKDLIGKTILTFKAEDPDLNDIIVYSISQTFYETHGQYLGHNNDDFLTLDKSTGVLSLKSYVTNNMKGYLKFEIEALDLAKHIARAAVKIYIVSERNRVKFVFLSDIQIIRNNEKYLREQFQEIYGYEICNIDSIEDVTNSRTPTYRQAAINYSTPAFITEVKVHFIHNNEAVEAYDIQKRSNDLAFISRLQNSLQQHNLILNDIPHTEMETETAFVENWLISALATLNVVLGSLSIIMMILYVAKVRNLKRQLKAFEPTKFGSLASNLNRLAGPSMNIFSVEGSNPVFKKQSNEITQKEAAYENETSSDSDDEEDDFKDLHNDPLFEMNNINHSDVNNKTATSTFEHKILNNDFFTMKEKSNNLDNNI